MNALIATVTVPIVAPTTPVDFVPLLKATVMAAPVGAVTTFTSSRRTIVLIWGEGRAMSAFEAMSRVPGKLQANRSASVTTEDAPMIVEEVEMSEYLLLFDVPLSVTWQAILPLMTQLEEFARVTLLPAPENVHPTMV